MTINQPLRYNPGGFELTIPKLTQEQLNNFLRNPSYKVEFVGDLGQSYNTGWEWLGYWRKVNVKENIKKSFFKYVI